ncbi:MRN complex-interacting protein isoform X1 [Scomber scombrus]|uniref:MRN complex-interacting protein isoform X1 n=1 Tax=Scomber scombrus TaxID=13677 RepID=A0AAV1Q8R2_SCOSC
MSQQFHVLRCVTCQSFQVQQVKKVNRWSCKLCGEKQSLLKEFGRGSGADCRRHVQKLNAMRGAVMEEQEHDTWSLWNMSEQEPEEPSDAQVSHTQASHTQVSHTQVSHTQASQAQVSHTQVSHTQVSHAQVSHAQVSRWSKYLDTPEETEPEENVLTDRQQLQGNPRKRMRTDGSSSPEQVSGCRRAASLSADCQERKGEESTVSGRSYISRKAPPRDKPRPQLPVSSMFESGNDFTCEEF